MTTPLEMLGWSMTEIQAEICHICPPEWHFQHRYDGGWVSLFINRQDGEVIWHNVHPDERINLFNAHGFIWLKTQPKTHPDSPWNRRRELTSEIVRQTVFGPQPEIPDLDPAEIKSVYETLNSKKGDH